MVGLKVICVEDNNRPSEFPLSLWVKKDDIYTISAFDKMHQNGGIIGIQVAEIDTRNNFPYTHFAFYRFAVIVNGELSNEEIEALIEPELIEAW